MRRRVNSPNPVTWTRLTSILVTSILVTSILVASTRVVSDLAA